MLGFAVEDFPPPIIELWPENWPPIRLFTRVCTQWRIGMNGPIGLDYNVIFHELDRAGIAGAEYDDTMDAIRAIESIALEEINKG